MIITDLLHDIETAARALIVSPLIIALLVALGVAAIMGRH